MLPIDYQYAIQGFIYQMIRQEEYGEFYHNVGYGQEKYKMFVFSNLIGKYQIENKKIIFKDNVTLHIAAKDSVFIEMIFKFLTHNSKINILNEILDVVYVKKINDYYFQGIKEFKVKTLSPITSYRTIDNKTIYYKPSDEEGLRLMKENLFKKVKAYQNHETVFFDIKEILYEKKRVINIKGITHEAYDVEMHIYANAMALNYLLNTGISSKGSMGFGMLQVVNEKDRLSL